MSNFWREIRTSNLNPRSRVARTARTQAESGAGFGANTYLVQGKYLDPTGQVRSARFQFKLLELLDRSTGFQSRFNAHWDPLLKLHHIDLGPDANLGLHRLQQIARHVIPASYNQILDSAQIDPHAVLLHAVSRLDPGGQYQMQTGILKITGSPTIPVDRRILSGEINLKSDQLPPDLRMYYHIHVDGSGNRTIVMNNAQAQRFVMDFDGDPLIFHKLIGVTSSGQSVSTSRGHKYPILQHTGQWIEVPDWNPLADLGMVTNTRISHLVQHFGSAQGLQADALASSRQAVTDEVARRQIQSAMVPDIIGQTFNKLNAESRAQAEIALAEGIKSGTLDPKWGTGARRATFISSYGIFEGFQRGMGLEGTNQKALFNEYIIKTVAKGKPIPSTHPASLMSRGFSSMHQALQTQDQSRPQISVMIDLLDSMNLNTEQTLAQSVMEYMTGQHTGPADLINKGRIKTKLVESVQRRNLDPTQPSIIRNLTETGQLRFKRVSWSGTEMPEWFRQARPNATSFDISIPEHLVNGEWLPLGGGIPSSYAINKAKRGIALPYVWNETDSGTVSFQSGLEHLEEHLKRKFDEIGYRIRDPIESRLIGQTKGSFSPDIIGTDRGKWARKSISKHLGVSESDIFNVLNTDRGTGYRELVLKHDLTKYAYKQRRAMQTLKEAGDMFGTEITYVNEGFGTQITEATSTYLRGIAMFDSTNPADFLIRVPNILRNAVKFRKNKITNRPVFGAGYVFPTRADGSSMLGEAGNLHNSARIAQISTQLKDRIIPESGTNIAYINLDDKNLIRHLVAMNPGLTEEQIQSSLASMYSDVNNLSPDVDSGVAWITEAGRVKYQNQYKNYLLADDSVDAITGLPARWSGKLVDPSMKLEANYIKGLDVTIHTPTGSRSADVIVGLSERLSRGGLTEALRQRVTGPADPTELAMYSNYMESLTKSNSEYMTATEQLLDQLSLNSSMSMTINGQTTQIPLSIYSLGNRSIGMATTPVEVGTGASYLERGLSVHETGGTPNKIALLNDMTSDIFNMYGVQLTEPESREAVHSVSQLLKSSIVDSYLNKPHSVSPEESMDIARQLSQALGMTDVESSVARVLGGLDDVQPFNMTRILKTAQRFLQFEE